MRDYWNDPPEEDEEDQENEPPPFICPHLQEHKICAEWQEERQWHNKNMDAIREDEKYYKRRIKELEEQVFELKKEQK